jgi:hypothetical protein
MAFQTVTLPASKFSFRRLALPETIKEVEAATAAHQAAVLAAAILMRRLRLRP